MDFAKIGEQALGLWRKLSPARKIGLGVLFATIAAVAALLLRPPAEEWATLYAGLSAEDAGKVIEQLKVQAAPYKLEHEGTAISVPAARVHELRIALASSGLPRGGAVGFELFDKQTFGTTSFVEQMNYQRALAGELARTIMSIEAVERARVHVAMKQRSLFVANDEPPSASVVIELRPNQSLSPRQVKGIVHLVSSSVEGLRPDRVSIVDGAGEVLWSGEEEVAANDFQKDLERTLARRVQDITDRVVGAGRSVVVVTSELDTALTERTEETYDPVKVAIRSESRSDESSDAAPVAGLAGVRGNLGPADPAASPVTATKTKTKQSETKNYEVGRVLSKVVGPKVQLRRLHVAVLVDSAIAPDGSPTIQQIELLARAAAGLDPSRGDAIEVHGAPFAAAPAVDDVKPAPAPAPLASPIEIAIGAGLALLALVAVIVVRIRRKRAVPVLEIVEPVAVAALEAAELGPPIPSPRERAFSLASGDAARAAQVLKGWVLEAETGKEMRP